MTNVPFLQGRSVLGFVLFLHWLFQYFLQASQQLVAGVVHMPFADGKGACFVARRNGRSQFLMLVPDGQTLFC